MTLSSVSVQPLNVIAYPPNAGFFAFAAMSTPPLMIVALGATSQGYYYHRYEGGERKNPTSRGPPTDPKIPPGGTASGQRGHDLAREPAQLLHELLGREPLGPVDHEVLEPGILGLDGADALDDVGGRP